MTALSAESTTGRTGDGSKPSALLAVDNPSGAVSLRRSIESLGWDCRTLESHRDFEGHRPVHEDTVFIVGLEFDGVCGVGLASRLIEQGVLRRVVFWSPDAHIPANRLADVTSCENAELLIGEVSSENLTRAAGNTSALGLGAGADNHHGRPAPAAAGGWPRESIDNETEAAFGHVNGSVEFRNGGSRSGRSPNGRRSPLFDVILGSSPAMCEVRQTIEEVAPTKATVLVSGPSGTGKELVARSIHQLSQLKSGPFVPVNLAAIPESLAESQLFGHEKGAFTNALHKHEGFCLAAHQGTLFLDEISEMPIALQPKLLRFMQEKTIQTLGSTSEHRVDARVVSAMNRDPASVVREGAMREDLYFRLNVVPIRIPPLNERREDIEQLALAFLRRSAEYHERDVRGFTPAAIDVLSQFDWPGNVRQLENAIERIVIFCRGAIVDALDIPSEFHGVTIAQAVGGDSPIGLMDDHSPEIRAREQPAELTPMQKKERETIVEALQRTDGHVIDAANLLGIGQATLYRKLKQYSISRGPRRRRKSPR